ncbi:MAG: flagellar basal body rod protein FlgB [bacterium]
MKIDSLEKTLVPLLKKSLDAYSVRQQAITENIANIDTPGYKPIKVSFEEKLRHLLNRNLDVKTGNLRHMDSGANLLQNDPSLFEVTKEATDVNLEDQMAELAKNQIRFEFATRMLNRTYEMIRASITGHVR